MSIEIIGDISEEYFFELCKQHKNVSVLGMIITKEEREKKEKEQLLIKLKEEKQKKVSKYLIVGFWISVIIGCVILSFLK